MIFLIYFILSSSLHAESANPTAVAKATPTATVKSISIFRNEVQLGIGSNSQIKVGTKFLARTSVNHKCLLEVKKIIKDLAYTDANQCPGYATLKKGQVVPVSPPDEVNEEVKSVPVSGDS